MKIKEMNINKKTKRLPKTENGWIQLFYNTYGKEPTGRELLYYKNYKIKGEL
jgi:hypothetical protein